MSEIATRSPQKELAARLRTPGHLEQFAIALEGSGISAEKFVRVALTASLAKPELAEADQTTLLMALLRCAELGLLPDNEQATINVYKGKAQLLVMVGGVKRRLAEFGWALNCRAVYANDTFEYEEEPPMLRHAPARLGQPRGDLVAAYAVATHKDGRRMQRVLLPDEIAKRRAQAKTQNVWNNWEAQMWEKSAAHEIADDVPLDPKDRERIEQLLSATDLETGERVDLLYGDSPGRTGDRTPSPETPTPSASTAAASGQQASGSLGGDPEAPGPEHVEEAEWSEAPPFEGEEPPPVTDEPAAESEPTFVTGRYEGKTIAEVYGSGADGLSYVKWAVSSWKTEPLRAALDRFAETHPDVKP